MTKTNTVDQSGQSVPRFGIHKLSDMRLLQSDHFSSWISLAIAGLVAMLLSLGLIPKVFTDVAGRLFRSIADRKALLLILIPAGSFVVNSIVAINNGIPRPRVQDEFSYLLAADTFSHGRLTNPTPLYWEHFETPHELMHPTYMSKYPPAQGLILAMGQLAMGMPIVGVWLTTAAACGCIYWMLSGFVNRPWAFVGGIIVVMHPLMIHWSQIYWGGSVAVMGGALLLGAWIRLYQRSSVSATILFAVGLIALANSRPFEGLIYAIPFFAVLIFKRKLVNRQLVFLSMLLLPAAVLMAFYNFQVTGHMLRMPFQEYSRQYDVYPKFWFLSKNVEPIYRNESMRLIHTVYERGDYDQLRTPQGLIKISGRRLWQLLSDFANPGIVFIALVGGVAANKNSQIKWVWFAVVVFVVGLCTENFFLPHYAAPMMAALFLCAIIGLNKLYDSGRAQRILCQAVIAGFLAGASVSAATPPNVDSKRTGQLELVEQTESLQSGNHLIFVVYTADHLMHDEWVYNAANLQNSKIIWARSIDKQANLALIEASGTRMVWLLTVGEDELNLVPYPQL